MNLILFGHSVLRPGELRMSVMAMDDGDDARALRQIEHEASGYSSRSSWPPETAVLFDAENFRCIWEIDRTRERHLRAVITDVATRYTGDVPDGVTPVDVLDPGERLVRWDPAVQEFLARRQKRLVGG